MIEAENVDCRDESGLNAAQIGVLNYNSIYLGRGCVGRARGCARNNATSICAPDFSKIFSNPNLQLELISFSHVVWYFLTFCL